MYASTHSVVLATVRGKFVHFVCVYYPCVYASVCAGVCVSVYVCSMLSYIVSIFRFFFLLLFLLQKLTFKQYASCCCFYYYYYYCWLAFFLHIYFLCSVGFAFGIVLYGECEPTHKKFEFEQKQKYELFEYLLSAICVRKGGGKSFFHSSFCFFFFV